MSMAWFPFPCSLLIVFFLVCGVLNWPTFLGPTEDTDEPYFEPSESLLGIVNGVQVDSGEWPFVASLQLDGHKHFCGGTVWNANYILTAAHCTKFENGSAISPSQVSVYVGHTNIAMKDPGWVFQAAELIPHEKFTGSAPDGFDIAAKPLSSVYPSDCYVIGWGSTHEGGLETAQLREVKVPLRDYTYCKEYAVGRFDISMLCAGLDAGGKDACQGDSGGPLICSISRNPTNYAIVGIVSYGKGCAEKQSPGFYTKVHYFLDWIAGKTGC